jgi:hypothetical protein
VSALTSTGVYKTVEPAFDHFALTLPDPPPLRADEEE